MRIPLNRSYFTLLISLMAAFFASSVFAADIDVKQAYARATPPVAKNSAAYMQLHNNTGKDVVIVSASSKQIPKVEFHAHKHQNGTMRMTKVENITVPAHGDFHFMPGQHHIMLMGLTSPLSVGETIPLELKLSNGDTINVDMPVKPVGHKVGEHKMEHKMEKHSGHQMKEHKSGGHSH